MKTIAAIVTLLLADTACAQAADLIVYDEPPASASQTGTDWSGFYAGVIAGYGSGTVNYPPVGGVAGQTVSVSGGLAGVAAGYNAQWDMFVLGIEGDVSVANIAGTTNATGFSVSSNVNWIATLRGRAGLAVDAVLFYATAGVATGAITTQLTGFAGVTPYTSTHVGWAAGVGVELAVTDNVSVKAEYAYSAFNSQNIPANALFPGSTASTLDASFHTVKVGANLRF